MIDRKSSLTPESFLNDYVRTRTPVILENMMGDWPAMTLWTQDYLKAIGGDQPVEVMADRDADPLFEQRCDHHRQKMPFSAFVDLVFSGVSSNNIYLVANNQFMSTPAGLRLAKDIRHGQYLNETDAAGRVFLWFGPAGTVTPLHHDIIDIILAQVRGSKRLRLFTAEQKPLLYNSVGVYSLVDCENPDFRAFPLYRQARPEEIILHAGEMLFLPDGHWHQVVSLEPSISISFTNLKK